MPKSITHLISENQSRSLAFWGLFIFMQILVVLTAFAAGYYFHRWYVSGDLSLASRALQLVKENSYDPLPQPTKLQYGMIKGLVQALNDPFASFFEPPQAELRTNQLEGKFGGIGVRIERDDENYIYLYPLPGSPAELAGIQEGDRLLAIDSFIVTPETSFDEVQASIRGPVGQRVRVTIGREPSFTPVEVVMERAEVPLPSVTWNFAPEDDLVGVIQIHVMAETTPGEVQKAILDLQQRGATHFILDVRNNGGGLVESGVDTARLFLQDGIVIQQQYRNQEVKTFSVEKSGPFTAIPLAILTNKGTASAAEILAGALQGQKRALLVGEPTYGKDSIQLAFDLGDGSSLQVTAARWWVPGLEPAIHGNGLQPDIPADGDGPNSPLSLAIQSLRAR